MGKTFIILAAFASTALVAGAASAGGRNGGYHAPQPQPQPAVSVGVGAKVGGLLNTGLGLSVGGGSLLNLGVAANVGGSSHGGGLLNLGVAAQTPVANAAVGAKVGGHGGNEIALGADVFGGGVGR